MSAEAIPASHPLHTHFVDRYARLRDQLAGDLRARQESGDYRKDLDPDLAAGEIIATLAAWRTPTGSSSTSSTAPGGS